VPPGPAALPGRLSHPRASPARRHAYERTDQRHRETRSTNRGVAATMGAWRVIRELWLM
jgi:hypothetical protein